MADQPAPMGPAPMVVTVDELYALIGRQLVEIQLLRARLELGRSQTGPAPAPGPAPNGKARMTPR
jgi:hypothetical protein